MWCTPNAEKRQCLGWHLPADTSLFGIDVDLYVQQLTEIPKLHTEGSDVTWVKNEVRHGHFKSCRSPTWAFIKTVESDIKVL